MWTFLWKVSCTSAHALAWKAKWFGDMVASRQDWKDVVQLTFHWTEVLCAAGQTFRELYWSKSWWALVLALFASCFVVAPLRSRFGHCQQVKQGYIVLKIIVLQVLVDYNAGTKVSDVKLRSIPLLRGDVAAYVSPSEARCLQVLIYSWLARNSAHDFTVHTKLHDSKRISTELIHECYVPIGCSLSWLYRHLGFCH